MPSPKSPRAIAASVLSLLAWIGLAVPSAQAQAAADSLGRLLDSVVPAAMRDEAIPGVAVTVVEGPRVLVSRGYGVADLGGKRPVSADSTIWRIGSISKIMTATGLVQLADRGRLDLHADVNHYLLRIRVPQLRGAPPITAWHLLTHSAGLDELRPGTQAGNSAAVLPLDRFLEKRLVRVHPPGEITSYSTYAITLAGLLIQDVSGLSFETYLQREVWRPLGMLHTSITIPARDRRLVATGYDVEDGRPQEAGWEWYHTTPASSVNATARDMARFLSAQLSGGALDGVRVLSDSATAAMQRRQLTMHPRMPGWGLGWQEDELLGWTLMQHGGDVAGFSSLLTLVPARQLGIFVVSHREGSDLRFVVRDALLRRLLPSKGSEPPAPFSPGAAHTGDYAGRYRASIACHTCPNGGPPVPTLEVAGRDDGSLTISEQRWVEVDTDLFQSESGRRVGFRRDAGGRVTHLTMGSWKGMERVR
jgi:CubicO group peptidase (beta-lactamase class C family)